MIQTHNARPHRWLLLAGFLLILTAVQAHAQGCTQCLDSTRATPPAVQAAYRHAIYLLGGVGATLFLVGLYLLRREP
ncbi:MAG TPA: copper resistance protein CopC [Acidobacteriaceae bacterium]